MRFPYHDIYDAQYESLVALVGTRLLGPGIQPFSSGPDGARDARFQGTADRFPSAASPLSGQFVLQAKHTEHPFERFSTPAFSGDAKDSVLTKEIPRIKALVDRGELDHYLLFANRRLAGGADEQIRTRLIKETGARSVHLFGTERLDLVLKTHPDIEATARLTELSAPLRVTSDHLAQIIEALSERKAAFEDARRPEELQRVAFEKKNELNRLSDQFSKLIRREYLSHFSTLKSFLADPRNDDLTRRYEEAAVEFHEQIVAHAHDFPSLDVALVNIQRLLFERDPLLGRNVRLTKLVLYYMYWNCDIGEDGS